MHRRTTNTLFFLVLLATIGLTASAPTCAQGAQHNETDIAFVKRMTTRLQRVVKQAEKLEDIVKDMSKQASRNESTGQDQFGNLDRIPRSDTQSDYRRASMKMRSAGKRAAKERERLVDLQRSGNSIDPADRDRIEATVSSLERNITDMEHDIRLRRF